MNDDSSWIGHCSSRVIVLTNLSELIDLRVCVFVPLQSCLMRTFHQAIFTHWSQVQTKTSLTYSVLMTGLHSSNRKRPPDLARHTHTHVQWAFSIAHSFTPTRSGWKLPVVSPGACNVVDLMHDTNRRKLKIRLVGFRWHKMRKRGWSRGRTRSQGHVGFAK